MTMENLKSIEVWLAGRLVGTMALTPEALCAFEYDAHWLQSGYSVSPFELPLQGGVFVAKREPFEGGFGVFDDCLPDGWGLLIMDRYLQSQGIVPRQLNLLDRLALVGTTGRGALEFRPDRSLPDFSVVESFERLAHEVEEILGETSYSGKGLTEMYRRGGSPGGARPKVFVSHEGAEWLVKFPAREDPKDIGQQEYRYAEMARTCGIEMMDCRLFEGQYFGTMRFDRTPTGEKIHVVSMAGLLCADYRTPCMDYDHIFQVASRLTHDQKELWKIFRLMCFNYVIGNKDDHAKNFAFLCREGEWHFAPAYDLLPSYGMQGYHTTAINDSIIPTDSDLLALATRYGLNIHTATAVLEEIKDEIP